MAARQFYLSTTLTVKSWPTWMMPMPGRSVWRFAASYSEVAKRYPPDARHRNCCKYASWTAFAKRSTAGQGRRLPLAAYVITRKSTAWPTCDGRQLLHLGEPNYPANRAYRQQRDDLVGKPSGHGTEIGDATYRPHVVILAIARSARNFGVNATLREFCSIAMLASCGGRLGGARHAGSVV